MCEWLVTLAAGLAGINCHCQWGLTGLLGGIVIMLAAGDASDISAVMCNAAFVGKSSGKGLEKRSKTHQKHKIQTCQVSSQHCPSSSAGSATSGTMMLGWKVRDRSNLSFYHGLRLMTVPMWCFLTFDNIWRHVIWYSKNKALCWFWFLLGVAMTVFGAFYECFCFKPVYKSVQAGQINWCKEWLVALISIVSSPVTGWLV